MIAFMYGYFFIKILKIVFYVMIAIFAIIIIAVLYQYGKELYVLRNFDNVYKIEMSKPIQTYRREVEESGFSMGRYLTRHYRIKRVPDKKIRKVKVYFKNGRCLRLEITENSKIYTKIMNRV